MSALNGTKYLIKGNHDVFLDDFGETEGWFKWVKDYAVIMHGANSLILFHYPIVEWYKFGKGSIHLHGHLHNSKTVAPWDPSRTRALNVGVDVHDFNPISIKEVLEQAHKIPKLKRHRDDDD